MERGGSSEQTALMQGIVNRAAVSACQLAQNATPF
jgi:hypothetical protein